MTKEISAGMLVYNKQLKKFLVLEYESHFGFVKGRIEKNENEKEAAIRELKEETGIEKFEFLDFKEEISYFYKKDDKNVYKKVIFFLIETNEKEIRLSSEHKSFKWCDYKEAYKLIKFKNAREVLKNAKEYLKDE